MFFRKKKGSGKIGDLGESIALAYLLRQGYDILTRNYRRSFGEIDIVARDGETVVFVEVKTRRHQCYGLPSEAVDVRKQRRLSKTALDYLVRHKFYDVLARFDVVAVYLDEKEQPERIELIQNAFDFVDIVSG